MKYRVAVVFWFLMIVASASLFAWCAWMLIVLPVLKALTGLSE